MYGGGAKLWPGGGATGGAGGAGHRVLAMKGASTPTAAGGGGDCGRPTSAVVHVPTQRSASPLWANRSRPIGRSTNASTLTAATLGRRSRAIRSVVEFIA